MSDKYNSYLRRRISPDIIEQYFEHSLKKWSEVYNKNFKNWNYYTRERFLAGVISVMTGDLYLDYGDKIGELTDEKWHLFNEYLTELYGDRILERFQLIKNRKY